MVKSTRDSHVGKVKVNIKILRLFVLQIKAIVALVAVVLLLVIISKYLLAF